MTAPGEELIVGYALETTRILEGSSGVYFAARGEMFDIDGRAAGHYDGLLTPAGAMDLGTYLEPPAATPGEPVELPSAGSNRVTFHLGGGDSIETTGTGTAQIVPLADGSQLFMVSAMGIVTSGGGRYRGARGVESASGTAMIPPGTSFGPGTTLHFKTFYVIRVVHRQATGAPARSVATGDAPPSRSAPAAPTASAPAAGANAAPPSIPGIPSGVDPATYKLKTVDHLFSRIASFLFIAWPDLTQPGVEILSREQTIGNEIHQQLHRFDVRTQMPTARGITAINRIEAGIAADFRATWRLVPDGYVASAGAVPPPTPVDRGRSQRFVMPEARLRFRDSDASSLRLAGNGRTFPFHSAGRAMLGFGAALDIEAGTGRFSGLQGMVALNGDFDPSSPGPLALLVRVADPSGNLLTDADPPFQAGIPDPTPGITYLTLKGENNPNHSTSLIVGPDGKMQGAHGRQVLRLVRVEFTTEGRQGLRTRMTLGPVVAKLDFTLSLDPTVPPPAPMRTTGSRFEFFDRSGAAVGSFGADMVAGESIPTELPGAPTPVMRGVGIAPLIRGTGLFAGVEGLLTVQNWISVFPRQVSSIFLLRVVDPDGRFRARTRRTWRDRTSR